MRPALIRSVLFGYRFIAIVALYGVLAGVCGYAFVLGFYGVSTSWIAPVTLSPYDDKSLGVTEKLVTSTQTMETLTLEVLKLEVSLAEMKQHRAALAALEPQVEAAIAREMRHNQASGVELVSLDQQKHGDNQRSQAALEQTRELEEAIDRELDAGLITKGDAAMQRLQLSEARRAMTDSRISEVLLRDHVLQKNTASTQLLDVLDKRAELASQVAQLEISIAAGEKQLATEQAQIERLRQAIELARHTPYFLAASAGDPVQLAFVPYENVGSLAVGAPVYDCYLNMIACRRVGAVKQVFNTEERAQNPVFRTDMRGTMVQLELDDPNAAMSRTLFLNRKPLFI